MVITDINFENRPIKCSLCAEYLIFCGCFQCFAAVKIIQRIFLCVQLSKKQDDARIIHVRFLHASHPYAYLTFCVYSRTHIAWWFILFESMWLNIIAQQHSREGKLRCWVTNTVTRRVFHSLTQPHGINVLFILFTCVRHMISLRCSLITHLHNSHQHMYATIVKNRLREKGGKFLPVARLY